MIKIKNLEASIDDKTILKGINLEIPAGEVHVIMGRNGSGTVSYTHLTLPTRS